MYYDEFFPFFTAYGDSALYDGEKVQEKEFELMKSWYPETVRNLQERIQEECDLLDYEGSRIYDQYPDRFMLQRDCTRICSACQEQAELQAAGSDIGEALLEILFWQEISRRRCRRRRCRGY